MQPADSRSAKPTRGHGRPMSLVRTIALLVVPVTLGLAIAWYVATSSELAGSLAPAIETARRDGSSDLSAATPPEPYRPQLDEQVSPSPLNDDSSGTTSVAVQP